LGTFHNVQNWKRDYYRHFIGNKINTIFITKRLKFGWVDNNAWKRAEFTLSADWPVFLARSRGGL